MDDDASRELLALFVLDAPERILRIEGHLAAGGGSFATHRAAAAHEAHSLYGAAATLRLDGLATLAQRLELLLEDGADDGRARSAEAREMLAKIRIELYEIEIEDDVEESTPANALGATQRTVLLVEDNPVNVALIERALARRPGVRLLTAPRADKGLRLARAERPDLILLDLHLPDASGRDFLARLRSDPSTSGTAVVVVSADTRPDALQDLGVRERLSKPVDIKRLLELVDGDG